jgi:hypothetical protein
MMWRAEHGDVVHQMPQRVARQALLQQVVHLRPITDRAVQGAPPTE